MSSSTRNTTSLLLSMVFSASAVAEPLISEFNKGYLSFQSDDGSYKMQLDGRIMLDTGAVSASANELKADTLIRRARLGFKTEFDQKWRGEFDIDFEADNSELKDMWIAYTGIPNTTIKFGNQKPVFSLSNSTSSRWYTFMEVPLAMEAFSLDRRIGLSVGHYQQKYFISGTLFGDEVSVNTADEDKSESFGFASRGVYRPYLNDDLSRFFHIGYNYASYSPQSDAEDKVKFKTRPETHVVDYKFFDTGKIKNVDDTQSYALEFAGRFDKWSAQAEYIQTKVNRNDDKPNYQADGYFASVSYFIIGAGRDYNLADAEFGRVIPQGEHGDLELALRYSHLDLNDADADIFGGSGNSTTLALNWYAHSNIVFRLNYIRADLDEHANDNGDLQGNEKLDIYAMRLQYLF